MNKALFLDRDGVINIDKGYVHKADDCIFIDGIFELVKKANDQNYRVVIVTNQAGIARGYYSELQFHDFTHWMLGQFKLHDARIDHVYFCPHHPQHGMGKYAIDCECRKPKPGMLLTAAKELDIDLKKSIMVGDNLTDLDAAETASLRKFYLLTEIDIEVEKTLSIELNVISKLSQISL